MTMEQPVSWQKEGVVIGVLPYSDNDLILRVIAKDEGKVSLYARRARNSKKRFGAPFDLFDRGNFGYRESRGSLLELTHFSPSRSFKNLRQDLTKLAVASAICEAFDLLTIEQDPNPSAFVVLEPALSAVEDAPDTRAALRQCCSTLSELLVDSGYAEPGEFSRPSAHGLIRIFHRIEVSAERQLKTKVLLGEVLDSLRSVAGNGWAA